MEHKAQAVLQDSLPHWAGHRCPLRDSSGGTWRLREHAADSPDPELLSLTRPCQAAEGSRARAERLLRREGKQRMNGETDGIRFSCCQGRRRAGDTRHGAQGQLVTAVLGDGKAETSADLDEVCKS